MVKEFSFVRKISIEKKWLLLVLGILSVVLLYFKIFIGFSNFGIQILTAYFITFFIITVFSCGVECKTIEYIGANTISIYLLHVFIIVVFKMCWSKLNLNSEVLFCTFSVVFALVVSLAIYKNILAKIKPINFLFSPGTYLPRL